ncbi:hypothetical protein HAX54_040378 [Datura stramonium]|uniref:Uncharacterized protein n=1 Tax=Datura stramonium TaxID=4076 RepID=A0ABS8VP50_DATST|nr:hypothetical protein [Datura stramonium]
MNPSSGFGWRGMPRLKFQKNFSQQVGALGGATRQGENFSQAGWRWRGAPEPFQNGDHLNGCQNSYSPSPSPYYDPPAICDAYKKNEEEEHHAQISDMVKPVLEQMEVMREQYIKQEKAINRMSAKLTEVKAEIGTCKDLQVTLLANTQKEPQVEEKSEFLEQANK